MKFSELKKEAKIKLTGKMKKASCIYFFFLFLSILVYTLFFNILAKLIPNINLELFISILQDISTIVLIPFSFGIIASMLELSRNKDVKIFDFLKIGVKNIVKIFKLYIVMFIKLWKPILLLVVGYVIAILSKNNILPGAIPLLASITLLIVSLVLFIIKSLAYSLALYIFYDNPEDKAGNILDKSEKLMKGYKIKIVLLDLSFIGWILLICVLTVLAAILSVAPIISSINNILSIVNTNIHSLLLLIGILLLLPYMAFTKINFYEELISNEE